MASPRGQSMSEIADRRSDGMDGGKMRVEGSIEQESIDNLYEDIFNQLGVVNSRVNAFEETLDFVLLEHPGEKSEDNDGPTPVLKSGRSKHYHELKSIRAKLIQIDFALQNLSNRVDR